MCIYCRDRIDRGLTHRGDKSHLPQQDRNIRDLETNSAESFSSLDSEEEPQLCEKHRHRVTHNVYYSTAPQDQLYTKCGSSDRNTYRQATFRSPGKLQKVAHQVPTHADTRSEAKSDIRDLLKELHLRDKKIEELLHENLRLKHQNTTQKEEHNWQIQDLFEELRSRPLHENIETSRQDKKIELLLSQFEKFRNNNNEKLSEVKQEMLRIRSTTGFKAQPHSRGLVKKIVVEEECSSHWKDNFISAFNDMVMKISAKEANPIPRGNDLKKHTKECWRYLKDLFKLDDTK